MRGLYQSMYVFGWDIIVKAMVCGHDISTSRSCNFKAFLYFSSNFFGSAGNHGGLIIHIAHRAQFSLRTFLSRFSDPSRPLFPPGGSPESL